MGEGAPHERANVKGIHKATGAAQTTAAWADWRYLADKLAEAGRGDLIQEYQPKSGAGWRAVDKQIAKVRAVMGWPPIYIMREQDTDAE